MCPLLVWERADGFSSHQENNVEDFMTSSAGLFFLASLALRHSLENNLSAEQVFSDED